MKRDNYIQKFYPQHWQSDPHRKLNMKQLSTGLIKFDFHPHPLKVMGRYITYKPKPNSMEIVYEGDTFYCNVCKVLINIER